MIKYGIYTIETVPTGNNNSDCKADVSCHVYKATKSEAVDNFLITGNETSDYGSLETAVTAYMCRYFPDNDTNDEKFYRNLNKREQRLQEDYKKLILKLVKKHGGRITSLPIPDKYGCSDYPVTTAFYGKHDNPNISITNVYISEYGEIMVDGVNEDTGYKEREYRAYPEHYSCLLDFIGFALGLRNQPDTTRKLKKYILSFYNQLCIKLKIKSYANTQ